MRAIEQPTPAKATEPRDRIAAVARGSRMVAGCVLVSRITGFGRVAAAAAILGPTFLGNLFQLTTGLPMLVFGLLAGSLASAVLVPSLVRRIDAADADATCRLANGAFGVLLVLFGGIALLGILGAPLLLWLLTAAVQDPAVRAEQMRIGVPLLAAILPQLLCHAVSAIAIAVQQAHGRFAIAAAAPALENIGTIAALGAFAALYGTGSDIAGLGVREAMLLGFGTTAAVAASAAVQWWGAARAGVRLLPHAGWRQPEIRRLAGTGASSVGNTALSMLTWFATLVIAAGVPGGVVAYQVANSFIQLPIALTAGAVSAAQVPQLSRDARRATLDDFASTYNAALSLVIFAVLPASLFFLAVPGALAQAVAFGQMATPGGLALLTVCIAARGPGALAEAVVMQTTSASFARRDAGSPLRAMLLVAAISAVGMAAALATADPPTRLLALAGTASLASGVAALYLHRRQARRLPKGVGLHRGNTLANLVAALLAVVPAWLIVEHFGPPGEDLLDRILPAAAAGLAAGVTYLAVQVARGSPDLLILLPFLRRGRQRRFAGSEIPGQGPTR